MVRGSNRPAGGVWQTLHSIFASTRKTNPARLPIVALILSGQDRSVLSKLAGQEPLDIHFAESCEEAATLANQLTAPVILLDRNWPGTDWRTAVETLARAAQPACVILMSGVTDDYLWQELVSHGGYDVLAKPLRNDSVVRVIKLALTYLDSAKKTDARGLRRVAD
jgi:DNA-binding NtrC family response regulator